MKMLVNHGIGIMMLCGYLLKRRGIISQLRYEKWPKIKWILGHRGARAIAPENTLSSFNLAIKHGADGVEFDVCLSSDGVPVIIHDKTVDRTTDGHGMVQDFTAAELAKLNAAKGKSHFEREGIPSLHKTLLLLPDKAIANIELKHKGYFSKKAFVDKVFEIVKLHEDRLSIIVSSFDGELLALFRKKSPNCLISIILSFTDKHWPWSLKYLDAIVPDGLHLSGKLRWQAVLYLAQKKKIRVAIWTVNNPTEAISWFERGVDGIFTDNVPEIVTALR